jgi:bifunctional non-homologous end joining protein LigD
MNKVTLYAAASKGGQKQWSIWIEPDGATVTVEWGVVGGSLQRSSDVAKPKGRAGTASFKDAKASAKDNYDKQIRKKREEGYREQHEKESKGDWLMMLDKNFVPAKPVSKMELAELEAQEKRGVLWFQRKRDGRRHLALKTRMGDWKLYTRRIEDISCHIPAVMDALNALVDVPNGTILDGEIIVEGMAEKAGFRTVGTFTNYASDPDFAAATSRRFKVRFMVFDTLYWDGLEIWKAPYSARYEALQHVIPTGPKCPVYLAENLKMSFADARKLVEEKGWEGLVCWRHDQPSFVRKGGKPKRVNAIKWKPICEGDFIATGYYLGSGELSRVTGGLHIEEIDPETNERRSAGKVGTGFDFNMRQEILNWTFPCVVEVKYDSQEPTGKLRFPVFVRKRDDKDVDECIGEELETEA